MAPGPAGHRSPPAQGHVVGESLIAHGNAITQGEKCGVSISHGQCRRSCECALHDEAVSKGKNLNCVSCLISQTCFWRGWLRGTRYWGWTLSPAGKVFTAYVYSGPPYRTSVLFTQSIIVPSIVHFLMIIKKSFRNWLEYTHVFWLTWF